MNSANTTPAPQKKKKRPRLGEKTTSNDEQDDPLLRLLKSLHILDSLLQFLTRATGQALVPLTQLLSSKGIAIVHTVPVQHVQTLVQHGIFQIYPNTNSTTTTTTMNIAEQWKPKTSNVNQDESMVPISIGFPPPDDQRLSGSTKAGAKRRVAALKKRLKHQAAAAASASSSASKEKRLDEETRQKGNVEMERPADDSQQDHEEPSFSAHGDNNSTSKNWTLPDEEDPNFVEEPLLEHEREARKALSDFLGLNDSRNTKNNNDESSSFDGINSSNNPTTSIPSSILPHQVSYAGSHPAQEAEYYDDAANDNGKDWKQSLDPRLLSALNSSKNRKKLYQHQATAIQSALANTPTLVCTGTGSGKSLCFLIPVLQAALVHNQQSLLLFPTKALAQDQVVKLQAWVQEHGLDQHIRPATLDGDTPHSQRVDICTWCNVILTNPDTLHAAILPNWEHLYQPLLQNLRYVVLDEAHMYQGVFGAHVSMILARLYRVALVCCKSNNSSPHDNPHGGDNSSLSSSSSSSSSPGLCFLAYSATLAHPEHHFRLLCCISQDQEVTIVTKDASPRAAKHFWVWNPPLLDMNGKSLGQVKHVPSRHNNAKSSKNDNKSEAKHTKTSQKTKASAKRRASDDNMQNGPIDVSTLQQEKFLRSKILRRRHSADETALLLARAVSQGVRCIAFCKTRGLVEWVYERTLAALKQSPKTADLCSKVESYRGGYTKLERRQIEERLFDNQLLGVVGTSALELGVDIGGLDLTLHCGFPSSHASLLQQAGRAGRGGNASTSLAICVCFNGPLDQHLWRHPKSLLTRGLTAPLSMPIYPGLVQGHLLCAGHEFPLAGKFNVSHIQCTAGEEVATGLLLSDENLFGSKEVYQESLETLVSQGSLTQEVIGVTGRMKKMLIFKTHPSIKNPWTNVSIRSIEAISYNIVDISHPMQGGRTDGIHNAAAVMDTIPYSRVFYHAFPGAIIMHRGRRYKIVGMNRPPALGKGCFRGSTALGAFAKPCNYRYFTRPLSALKITVVKQMERVDFGARKSPENSNVATSVRVVTPDAQEAYSESILDPSAGSFAGCGIVTVKRTVHGYRKLSMVTREELSRSELSLPDMEYDTFAFWLDCDAGVVGKTMTDEAFGYGVHALSHAILSVSPMFVPCVMSDVQCDHGVYNPTRVTIFDARAGGSGICAQLWKSVFAPKGIVEAAIDLLEDCPSCSVDEGYDGGCPACLQAGECIKFNDFLSKSSGLLIAKHLLHRLKQTNEYKKNKLKEEQEQVTLEKGQTDEANDDDASTAGKRSACHSKDASRDVTSLRRRKRERAMRTAKDIYSARQRLMVVGRPSWPLDRSDGPAQEHPDN